MKIFHGKSVYDGIAIGPLRFWSNNEKVINRYFVTDTKAEYSRFQNALNLTIAQLDELKQIAINEVGVENAEIFEIHKLMLLDQDYHNSIENIILNEGYNSEYAVSTTCNTFAEFFSSMEDSYMQARAIDIKDISDRLINTLSDKGNKETTFAEPVILVAEDFTPSDTLQFDKTKILAFITSKGSVNSHTAILARTMNIPAIIGADLIAAKETNGKIAVIDGHTGNIYVDPDNEFLEKSYRKLNEEIEKKKFLQSLIGKENVTIDGKEIKLYANIGNIKDLSKVLENDASGIGLFRSEFIFLEKNTFPSEEEQFAIYKNAVETMNGKKVIIRTLDIGADKKVDYFNLKEEDNPALGLRAIRLCIKRPEIFKTQLRALLRAAIYGNLSIMYPMIISVEEVLNIKKLLLQTAEELKTQGIPFKIPEQGIMIETPASVMISDELAKEVSFFSIGTNDLSQYVMAIDRQNQELDDFFNPYHPAIMRMIEITVENAHKNGIWAGICGELASDLNLTERLLKMGVDELSVSPGSLLLLRKRIRDINIGNKK